MPNPDLASLTIGNGELAEFLGLSARHVSKLAQEGAIPRASRGRYPFQACVAAYVAHVKASAAVPASGLDEEEQRVRIEERKLRVRKLEGEVGDLAQMERDNFARGRAIRDLIAQLPARIAPSGATRLGCDAAQLRAWLDEIACALGGEILEAARGVRDRVDDETAEDEED